MMKIKPIKTESEYEEALDRLNTVFFAPLNTKEGQEAKMLVELITNYEDIHYPIDPPDSME